MSMLFRKDKTRMIGGDEALPGRDNPVFDVPDKHFVSFKPIKPPFPDGLEQVLFGLGCFWGSEEIYWQIPGVYSTAVGYAGGYTPNATYEEVCTGMTGHNEVVLVVYDPAQVSFDTLLRVFWESHDPTQGMRQGNDLGTQYRSGIYTFTDEQRASAEASLKVYQDTLREAGLGDITTEIVEAPKFWYAEDYHQQYLAKNPNGYRCHSATGVAFPANV